jgi:hypothetical protein
MKKSEFVLIKCKGCGDPFKARRECKPKPRPEECNYCKTCLNFRKACEILIDTFDERLKKMEEEIERMRKFHEEQMKKYLMQEELN